MNEVPFGYCYCGCGEKAPIAQNDHSRHGWKKGDPIKFLAGHNSRGQSNPRWHGGKRIRSDGYVYIWTPGHPRAAKNYVMEHILVAEKALGRILLAGAVVHHFNENRSDNENGNLVICQDDSFHKLLHARTRALKACGHASWRKCVFCKEWGDPANLILNSQNTPFHRVCELSNQRQRRAAKRKTAA